MPTVPKIENNVRSQGFNFSGSNAFIGSIPQFRDPSPVPDFSGVRRTGKLLQVAALDMKKKADETAIIEAQTRLDDLETSLLFDADEGAFSQLGKNALNIANTAGGSYKQQASQIRQSLGNDDQRVAFDRLFSNRFRTVRRQLNTHERSQMNAYQGAVAEQGISSALNHAAMNFNDPNIVAQSIDRAQSIARAQAGRSGLPVAQKLEEIESVGHTNALLAMIADGSAANIMQAKGRFESLKKDGVFTAADMLRVDSRLDTAIPDAAATIEFNQLPPDATPSDVKSVANDLEAQYKGSGKKFLALVEKRDTAAFYQQVDDDPLVALQKLEDGDYPGIPDDKKRTLKDHAQGIFEKKDEDALFRRLGSMTQEQRDFDQSRIDGTLSYAEIDAYESRNEDNPEAVEFAQFMKENLSKSEAAKGKVVESVRTAKEKKRIKGEEGPSDQQKLDRYNELWADYRNFRIEKSKRSKQPADKGTKETISEIMRFQNKVLASLNQGLIEEGEAESFKDLEFVLRSKVDKADAYFGNNIGKDIYIDAYDLALDFFADNPDLDTTGNRKLLFQGIFNAAEAADISSIEDPAVQEETIRNIGKRAIDVFAKRLDPMLQGFDELPGVVVPREGPAINIPSGASGGGAAVSPLAPLQEEYRAKGGRTITLEEIRQTAIEVGKTPQDVIRDLRAQGVIE